MKRIFSYTAKNGVKRGVCLSWNWTDRFVRYKDDSSRLRWLKFMFLPVVIYDYDCVEDAIEDMFGE